MGTVTSIDEARVKREHNVVFERGDHVEVALKLVEFLTGWPEVLQPCIPTARSGGIAITSTCTGRVTSESQEVDSRVCWFRGALG